MIRAWWAGLADYWMAEERWALIHYPDDVEQW